MSVLNIVESTVQGLGFALADLDRAGRLLRVFIERLDGPISIEDCEKVSRQLQYVLEVEGIDYDRLEVSSPGLDRPLKKLADFERFAGAEVAVRLRFAMDGRKQFTGKLLPVQGSTLGLEFLGKAREPHVLRFELQDVDKAHLVPQLPFKGASK